MVQWAIVIFFTTPVEKLFGCGSAAQLIRRHKVLLLFSASTSQDSFLVPQWKRL